MASFQTKNVLEISRWGVGMTNLDDHDDFSSAWEDCKRQGEKWGGRSKGGRGVRTTSGYTKDIVVDKVSLEFDGKALLIEASLRFLSGHIYGLVGLNGVGKSTLLRRMARGSVPGLPIHLKIVYMQQELPEIPIVTAKEYIYNSISEYQEENIGIEMDSLKEEEKRLEEMLDELMVSSDKDNSNEIEKITEKLCSITEKLDSMNENTTGQPSSTSDKWINDNKEILNGLGLLTSNISMLEHRMDVLSGGWRMRAALAVALINAKQADVLLLDEVSNHLDLSTLSWLERYLSSHSSHLSVIIVSHDSTFLDGLVTDIAEIRDQQIRYFNGTYSEWKNNQNELSNFFNRKQDALQRKTAALNKNLHSGNQSTSDVTKKIERASFQRKLDGRKYKQYSMKLLDEKSYRRAENLNEQSKIVESFSSVSIQFKLPTPDIDMLRLASHDSPLVSLDTCSLRWSNQSNNTLSNVNLEITLKSRIAIVGPNGQGKSTLISAIYGLCDQSNVSAIESLLTTSQNNSQLASSNVNIESIDVDEIIPPIRKGISLPSGKLIKKVNTAQNDSRILLGGKLLISGKRCYNHRQVKVAIVNQHHIDILSDYLTKSPMEYIIDSSSGNMNELESRAILGSFGLSGDVALQPIGSLSGGQKARLALAQASMNKPHILLLDEPTNNLSMEASNALANACDKFTGAIIVVSHNRSFLNQICKQLIIVDKGNAKILNQLNNSNNNNKLNEKDNIIGELSFEDILYDYLCNN